MQNECTSVMASTAGLVSFQKWLKGIGVTDVTGWRWRKSGLLDEPVNINGRLYLTAEQITRFHARVASGQFSKEHKTPALA
jgi:predicted site-specific integrase-resolvase